jgi:hypothetical protein
MKKIVLALCLLAAVSTQAQNLQFHYDFGKDRKYVTTTLEMFKADKWGSSFFFVDYDHDQTGSHSPSGSYMEITRSLNFWGGPLSAHVEYDGGLGYNGDTNFGYGINSAWLFGADYFMHSKDFSRTLTLQAMFKNIRGKNNTAQLTAVWGTQWFNKKFTFSGFADLWWEKNTYEYLTDEIHPVFLTEPQLWYNFTEHMSAGSEIELSTNFAGNEGFMVNPTLAVKWNF